MPPRVRNDTFSALMGTKEGAQKIVKEFKSIMEGEHVTYEIQKYPVNGSSVRNCWVMYSKKSKKPANYKCTKAYRPAMVWKHRNDPGILDNISRKEDQHQHLCGNAHVPEGTVCCNPEHLRIAKQEEKELDKCYHKFMHSEGTKKQRLFFKRIYWKQILKRKLL